MSNQTLVQSSLTAGPPSDAEYDAVFAELTATARGRSFLAEYANRNRTANTDLVIAAIARIEAAIQGGAAPQCSTESSRELTVAAATIEPERARTAERDEDPTSASARVASPPDEILDVEARKDRDYSDAVAMIAASLTALAGHSAADVAKEPEREFDDLRPDDVQSAPVDVAIGQADAAKAAAPRERAPQDNAALWHIESPDFMFGNGRKEKISSLETLVEAARVQPKLSSSHLLPELGDDQGDSFEAPPHVVAAEPAPASPVLTSTDATMPMPDQMPEFPAPLEAGQPLEISRPQLRIANSAVPTQRAVRSNSLGMTDALSDEEVIALFG